MSYLIFDTETSNFPSSALALSHPNQGRIIQLACLLVDKEFNELASFSSLIQPTTDFQISPGAFGAHGISIDKCKKYGMQISLALQMFNHMYAIASKVLVFNLAFDSQLIDIEESLHHGEAMTRLWDAGDKHICVMKLFTPICKLPQIKRNGYKWPKLEEAHTHCFGKAHNKAHDALADVRATCSIYRWYLDNIHAKQLTELETAN